MSIYKIFVLNRTAFLKDSAGTILNIIGIKSLSTGTGSVSDNLIDWKMLQSSDTTGNWIIRNPILGVGEIAFTTNYLYSGTNQPRFKVGNGSDQWVDLDYVPESSSVTEIEETVTLSATSGGVSILTLAHTPVGVYNGYLEGQRCTEGSRITRSGANITFDGDYTGLSFTSIYKY